METYKRENVLEHSTKYFKGDEFAASTWMKKYALKSKDNKGNVSYHELTPEDMHKRLAREFARIEQKYKSPLTEQEIYDYIKDFKYIIPQGGSMSGIGNDFTIQSLSNCFVIGNPKGSDSYGGIFRIDEEQTQLAKRRGGVGHDLSDLRPEGTSVTNAAETSSGVVSFMERYSNSIKEVAQSGRRGALMLSISIKHPDSNKFIDIKVDTTKVTGANCSVKITDEFMECVKNGKSYLQTYPIDVPLTSLLDENINFSDLEENKLYIGKAPNTFYKLVNAQKIWKKLMHNAWKSAEPGTLFWDKIISESPADCYTNEGFETVSTNPCGEIPMNPYDSCRLLSMNLYSYVDDPFTKNAKFNFNLFSKHVSIAQRLMDDMIDLEIEKIDQILRKVGSDPEDESIKFVETNLWLKIKETTLKGRRTGLGITGMGDTLAALNLTYASDNAIRVSEEIHKTLAVSSYTSSISLAKERGSFPIWDKKLEEKNPFINRVLSNVTDNIKKVYEKTGRRNISCLTIAPTGTTSILTQTTSGIEPAFSITYKRRRKTENKLDAVFTDSSGDMFEEYTIFHHKFVDWYRITNKSHINGGGEYTYEMALEDLSSISTDELTDLINSSPYSKSISENIDWTSKVKMQGRIQRWIDHSISSTTNLPKDATEELVNKVYMTAWEEGCKGCTVYRAGSRDGILLSTSKNKTPQSIRPDVIDAKVIRFINGKEKWIAFIGIVNGAPFELFTGAIDDDIKHLPKSITTGKIIRTIINNTEKRYDFQYDIGFGYKNHLPNIGLSFNPEYYNYARFVSTLLREGVDLVKIINTLDGLQSDDLINVWNKGVSRALKSFVQDGTVSSQTCEKCGSILVFENGCEHCHGCGYSKCD